MVEVNPSSDSTVQGCAEALETLVRDAGGPEGLARGEDVRIFTARVNPQRGQVNAMRARRVIEAWCKRHLRRVLPITHEKDWDMTLLFDDIARQVEVIREEYSAVTHAKIESLRKLGLDTAEGLAKNKGKHFGGEHLGELFAQPIVSRDWFGLLQRSVR